VLVASRAGRRVLLVTFDTLEPRPAPSHPVCRRPTHRGAGQGQGDKVERPAGRTTLSPWPWSARLCLGRRWTGWLLTIPESECSRRRLDFSGESGRGPVLVLFRLVLLISGGPGLHRVPRRRWALPSPPGAKRQGGDGGPEARPWSAARAACEAGRLDPVQKVLTRSATASAAATTCP